MPVSLFGRGLAIGGLLLVIALVVPAVNNRSAAQGPDATPPSPTDAPVRADLPDLGEAPELTNTQWLNSDTLRLEQLRGKVVLLNFWTFGCYNCRNVLPYVRNWHDTYNDEGLVVIGVHYPEFDYEADLNNLRDAVQRLGVSWAVAEDNDGATWKAYRNRFWPTIYLIDKEGHLRYKHIGEGAYGTTEDAIRALLNEPSASALIPAWQTLTFNDVKSNQPVRFADFAGNTVVVETFAVWCTSCRQQLARAAEIAPELEAMDVTYIALDIDPGEDAAQVADFAEANGYNWVFGVSSTELTAALIEQFGRSVTVPPSVPLFVIRPDGTTSTLYTGGHSADELRAIIASQEN